MHPSNSADYIPRHRRQDSITFPDSVHHARAFSERGPGRGQSLKSVDNLGGLTFSMRILVLSVNYWPEETGIGPLTTWRCEYLASRGHDVTVCTTLPYYPQWQVCEPYKRDFWRRESHNGVDILRSWSWIPKHVT